MAVMKAAARRGCSEPELAKEKSILLRSPVAAKRAVQGESVARRWYSEPKLGQNPEFQLAVMLVVGRDWRNRATALKLVKLSASGSAVAAIGPEEA
jgi:hypothetical protein